MLKSGEQTFFGAMRDPRRGLVLFQARRISDFCIFTGGKPRRLARMIHGGIPTMFRFLVRLNDDSRSACANMSSGIAAGRGQTALCSK